MFLYRPNKTSENCNCMNVHLAIYAPAVCAFWIVCKYKSKFLKPCFPVLFQCFFYMRIGTKDRVIAQLVTIAQHAVSQQAFGLWVASGLHLPTDLGYCVQHVQFGSRCWGGKGWMYHRLGSSVVFTGRYNNSITNMTIWFIFTWVRLEVFCCSGQEVKH